MNLVMDSLRRLTAAYAPPPRVTARLAARAAVLGVLGVAAAATVAGIVLLVWRLLTLAGHAANGLRPAARAIIDPLLRYLAAHATAVGVPAGTLVWIWMGSGLMLFLAAALKSSVGGRIGWILWGTCSAAMTAAATPPAGRWLALGLALIAWSLASTVAFPRFHAADIIVLREATDADPAGHLDGEGDIADAMSPSERARERDTVLEWATSLTSHTGDPGAVLDNAAPLLGWLENAADLADRRARQCALNQASINRPYTRPDLRADDPEQLLTEAAGYHAFLTDSPDPAEPAYLVTEQS